MLADPVEHISGIFQRSFRPAQRMTVDAWAEAYRTVFRPTPRPGPWSTDHVAYLREPMRDFTDPLVRRIVLMFGTQSGKTELILNCLGRLMDLDPDDTLLVIDSVDNARNFAKSRLLPMLRQNKRLSAYLPEKTLEDEGGRKKTERGKVTLQSLVLAEMTLWLTGSNSAGNLASKSVRTVLGDEIDKWPQVLGGRGGTEGSALQLMRERTRSYGDEAKEVIASTPTDEEVGIHKEFTATDQAEYHMPCPRCGQYQLLHFHADGRGGVRWEGGSGHDLSTRALAELAQRVRNTAWYECDHCGGRIESGEKSMMIMAGLWVRAGQRVEVKDPGKLVKLLAGPARAILARTGQSGMPEAVEQLPGAGVRLVGPKPMTDAHGYHASHLQSPFQTFGDMAARFVESRGEPGREWINSCLGEPYRKPGQRGDEQDLIELSRKTPDGEAPYQLGRVPRRAMCSGSRPLALIGSIDVQKDCVYYVVRGFGEREQAWLIDYGRVECPETMASGNSKQAVNEVVDEGTGEVMPVTTADPAIERLMADRWARVAELVSRTYQLHDGQDVAGMTPEPGAMPVRKWCIDARYRGREVLLFCQRMGAAVAPVMGSAQLQRYEMHRATTIGRTVKAGGVEYLNPFAGLELLLVNSQAWRDEVWNRMKMRPPAAGCWRWPVGMGHEYARQMTSEQRVVRAGPRGYQWSWELRPGRKDNHFWDCEVNVLCFADFWGMRGWTEAGTAAPAVAKSGGGVRVGSVRVG